MNLLVLDTSTPQAAVAITRADGAWFAATPDPAARHGRGLVPSIHEALRAAGLVLADLDGIAVGLGPGSFTGLRVGLMAAKTFGYVLEVPLVGLDSLEVIAQNAPAEAPAVSVAADAQRGELFTADFQRTVEGGPLTRVTETQRERADRWAGRLAPGTTVLGPALPRLVEGLVPDHLLRVDATSHLPSPAGLVALARAVWAAGRRDDLWSLEPLYLRRSAAEEKRDG